MTMTSAFQAGDLSGGIASGVLALAEHAHVPEVAAHRHPGVAAAPAHADSPPSANDHGTVINTCRPRRIHLGRPPTITEP